MELPIMLPIEKIVDECDNVKTFVFNHKLNARPGQFVIVWIPRLDEKPMSVSYQDKDKFAITVQAVGKFSKALHDMKVGDLVGIRGPYGNFFNLLGEKIAIVGGGCGCAPTAFLADTAVQKGYEVHMILAGKSKANIMLEHRMRKAGVNVYIATDDGSHGFKGFATDLLDEVLRNNKIDAVYTCGPEIMMKKIVEMSADLTVECSLERYMKCGFGICGQCCLDPTGDRVCQEGPVFNKEKLRDITEFGEYHRDATGKKVNL